MATRMFWRPLMGGVAWAGAGIGAGMVVPTALQASSPMMIYSTPLIASSFYVGALLVLFPIGMSRGIMDGVQNICQVHGRPALTKLVESSSSITSLLTTPEGNRQLLERLTLGSGWQGRLMRTLASPFLPSTAQMMNRLEELVLNKEGATGSSVVLIQAVDGFVEGFLQDKKDTITMLGLVGYGSVLVLGFGADYYYRSWHEKYPSKEEEIASNKESSQQSSGWRSLASRLGSGLSSNQEMENHVEGILEERNARQPKPIPSRNSRSLTMQETIDTARLQLVEMMKWMLQGKNHAGTYLEQTSKVAEEAQQGLEENTVWLWEQAKEQEIVDKDSQEKIQEHWKSAVASMQEIAPDEQTLNRVSKDMEQILAQAQQRLNDKDVQEMRKELENSVEFAKKKLAETRKEAKVDELFEQASGSIRSMVGSWWNGRG